MKIITNYNSNQKYQQHFGILIPPKGKALEIINARIGTDIELSNQYKDIILLISKAQSNNKTANMRIVADKAGKDLFVGVYKGDNKTLLKDFKETDSVGQSPMGKLSWTLHSASDFATNQIKIQENAKIIKNPQKYIENADSISHGGEPRS